MNYLEIGVRVFYTLTSNKLIGSIDSIYMCIYVIIYFKLLQIQLYESLFEYNEYVVDKY